MHKPLTPGRCRISTLFAEVSRRSGHAFSIAGKRGGFEDARGTLFFEIARIAAVKRPPFLLLENVPGLLSHDLFRMAKMAGHLRPSSMRCDERRLRRQGKRVAHTLTTDNNQGLYFIDMNPPPNITDIARCVTARQDAGISNHKGEHSGVLVEEARDNTSPEPDTKESLFTVSVADHHGIVHHGRVRKLTPLEAWRLQGFTDEQFYNAAAAGLSDGRLYKMAGNAVTVPVISVLGQVIKEIFAREVNKWDSVS